MSSLNLLRWMLGALLLALVPSAQREAARATGTRLDLEPFAARAGRGIRPQILPLLAGDKLLVSSGLRLFALDVRSAALQWSAGPPAGWDALAGKERAELFAGLDTEQLLIAPAAGERVAVAVLQVPLSRKASESWHGFPVSMALPERRLFAFELASGRPLWDHAPPADWDGRTGAFAQRMSVCASPLVVGARVLVPCTSDESSIDYHVACYQLETGALLWTAFVGRGQIERGSLGRQHFEFAAAPLRVAPDGERVLAQTDLGLVAALDLATGEILWRTEYAPIPIPKVSSFQAERRRKTWRTAPPLVVDDIVLATPRDCAELLALSLEDGRSLWRASPTTLTGSSEDFGAASLDHLIAAGGNTLYLGGARISAFEKPGGWSSPHGLRLLWTAPIPVAAPTRASLVGAALFVPTAGAVVELELGRGNRRGSFPIASADGLLAVDGALFALVGGALQRFER